MDETVDAICRAIASCVPLSSFRDPGLGYLHRSLVGMLLIAPLCATVGVQVIHFRMAFFAEAVGHSAFTGLGLGLLLSTIPALTGSDPRLAMTLFGAAIALAITLFRRRSTHSTDTVIGVFSSGIIALGLCLINFLTQTNRLRGGARLMDFLQGNILVLRPWDLVVLAGFFLIAMAFQFFAYNRLLFLGINAPLAKTMGIQVGRYEYAFAIVLALVVMFSIQAVGVLLVTAMLVIPAAAARHMAHAAGQLFWWGVGIAVSSAVAGLILSDRWETGTGATTVLVTVGWFLIGSAWATLRRRDA